MAAFPWQLIRLLRAKVREQEEQLRCLSSQLAVLKEFTGDGGEWGRFFKGELKKIQHQFAELHTSVHNLTKGQERSHVKIMATLQDLKDELATQNQAILDEMAEINAAMDELKLNPSALDEIVQGIKANTDTVKGIINKPLPEPTPEPTPVPEPEPAPPTPPAGRKP